MKKEQLELRLVEGTDKRFQSLVRALDQEQLDRFGDSVLKYRPYHDFGKIEQACLLVRGGQAVACGAFQKLDEERAELKRIYVRPDCRRRGYARQMIDQLELQALFGGYLSMAVATGRKIPEAIALYTKLGYRETEAWGHYIGDRACICMAKELE